MRLRLFLLLGAGLAAGRAFAQDPTATARDRVREGIQLHDAGRYHEAVAKYQLALAAVPDDTYAQTELALTYNAMGQHREAIALCKKMLKKPRPDATVYVTYGNSLDAIHKPKDAEQVYRRGLKNYPEEFSLYFNLGVTLARRNQGQEAIVSFERAVTHNPNHAGSHMSLGLVEQATGARVPAILALGRFLVLEPRSARAAQRLPLLDRAMRFGVKRDDDTHVTINLSAASLEAGARKNPGPDNFGRTETLLALASAAQLDSKNQDKTEAERFSGQFSTLCRHLAETKASHSGFIWEYYVPYFIELEQKGYVPAFTYLTHASQTDAADVQQWLAAHKTEVEVFQEWSKNFIWPKLTF